MHFNPRSPYGERPCCPNPWSGSITFQSTLPLRGATLGRISVQNYSNNFNPRSPYGERRRRPKVQPRGSDFNPRSPYGERRATSAPAESTAKFQSTLPLRGATCFSLRPDAQVWISIHAPLTGSDIKHASHVLEGGDFNPRSPYGERHTG